MKITCFGCLREFTASPQLEEKGRQGRYIVYRVLNRVRCPNCGNVFEELLEPAEGQETRPAESVAIPCPEWPVREKARKP